MPITAIFFICFQFFKWAFVQESLTLLYANNKGAAQPVCLYSLISTLLFATVSASKVANLLQTLQRYSCVDVQRKILDVMLIRSA